MWVPYINFYTSKSFLSGEYTILSAYYASSICTLKIQIKLEIIIFLKERQFQWRQVNEHSPFILWTWLELGTVSCQIPQNLEVGKQKLGEVFLERTLTRLILYCVKIPSDKNMYGDNICWSRGCSQMSFRQRTSACLSHMKVKHSNTGQM